MLQGPYKFVLDSLVDARQQYMQCVFITFEEEDCDAVLLVDAANAFNSINRCAMLENILRLCPIAYIYAYNCYAPHDRLFVVGGKELKSKEGTTQGDPVSMAFYDSV